MLPESRCAQDYPRRTLRRPSGGTRHCQDQTICDLNAVVKEGRDAVRPPQANSRAWSITVTRPMRRKRRILTRSNSPKPRKTGQNLSCTAANMQSPIRNALAPSSESHFLHSQRIVFKKNRPSWAVSLRQKDPTAKVSFHQHHRMPTWFSTPQGY
jgi:hypothetical protein